MNVYFLVEGRRTEKQVYPKFIEFFFEGKLKPVKFVHEVNNNNYFLLSANGYPRIFNDVLKDSILDINEPENNYQHLFLCIDADENTVAERKQELEQYLTKFEEEESIILDAKCQIHLIVQNRCIETWFLGNKKIYKSNPSSRQLVEYQQFYNVKKNDPELMPVFSNFDNHASFHLRYLKDLLLEKNITYTKRKANSVAEKHYIEQLIQRGNEDNHLPSFMYFYNLCMQIKEQINTQ